MKYISSLAAPVYEAPPHAPLEEAAAAVTGEDPWGILGDTGQIYPGIYNTLESSI